jgi:hypothetical protein
MTLSVRTRVGVARLTREIPGNLKGIGSGVIDEADILDVEAVRKRI